MSTEKKNIQPESWVTLYLGTLLRIIALEAASQMALGGAVPRRSKGGARTDSC